MIARALAAMVACGGASLAAAQQPDGAARTGLLLGIQATGGATWVPTGAELGLLFATDEAGRRGWQVVGRFGGYTFCGLSCDMHGWYAGLGAGLRRPLLELFDTGRATSDSRAVILQTFEAAAYLDHDSPTPDAAHATLGWSLELTVLKSRPVSETLIVHAGPLVFVGADGTALRWSFGARYQAPLGRD